MKGKSLKTIARLLRRNQTETEKKLVIELDGGQHVSQKQKDDSRTQWLEREGFKVIRFWDNEVFENINGVLETIFIILNHPHPSPHPSPLPQGERGPEGT